MGLDMYAWVVPADWAGDQQVDYHPEDGKEKLQIAYWRKFNHLHGWMERLYRQKGGAQQTFNCTTVRLTIEDLERLAIEAQDPKLFHSVAGFFFGSDELDNSDMESLEAFIDEAKELIQDEGKAVFYDSWW